MELTLLRILQQLKAKIAAARESKEVLAHKQGTAPSTLMTSPGHQKHLIHSAVQPKGSNKVAMVSSDEHAASARIIVESRNSGADARGSKQRMKDSAQILKAQDEAEPESQHAGNLQDAHALVTSGQPRSTSVHTAPLKPLHKSAEASSHGAVSSLGNVARESEGARAIDQEKSVTQEYAEHVAHTAAQTPSAISALPAAHDAVKTSLGDAAHGSAHRVVGNADAAFPPHKDAGEVLPAHKTSKDSDAGIPGDDASPKMVIGNSIMMGRSVGENRADSKAVGGASELGKRLVEDSVPAQKPSEVSSELKKSLETEAVSAQKTVKNAGELKKASGENIVSTQKAVVNPKTQKEASGDRPVGANARKANAAVTKGSQGDDAVDPLEEMDPLNIIDQALTVGVNRTLMFRGNMNSYSAVHMIDHTLTMSAFFALLSFVYTHDFCEYPRSGAGSM